MIFYTEVHNLLFLMCCKIRTGQSSQPSSRHMATTIGEGSFVKLSNSQVPAITPMLTTLTSFESISEISFIIYRVDATMMPATDALIPSSARYTVAYFFMLCQMG